MPSNDPEVKRLASLRYYHRHKRKLLAKKEAQRRAAGVAARKPGMTPDERREYARLRAERARRAKGIPPRTRRSPEAEAAAVRERSLARKDSYVKTGRARPPRKGTEALSKQRGGIAVAVKPPALPVKTAPAVVRNAWAKADSNSAIRRKWPTSADLQRAANEGAFDDVRTYV